MKPVSEPGNSKRLKTLKPSAAFHEPVTEPIAGVSHEFTSVAAQEPLHLSPYEITLSTLGMIPVQSNCTNSGVVPSTYSAPYSVTFSACSDNSAVTLSPYYTTNNSEVTPSTYSTNSGVTLPTYSYSEFVTTPSIYSYSDSVTTLPTYSYSDFVTTPSPYSSSFVTTTISPYTTNSDVTLLPYSTNSDVAIANYPSNPSSYPYFNSGVTASTYSSSFVSTATPHSRNSVATPSSQPYSNSGVLPSSTSFTCTSPISSHRFSASMTPVTAPTSSHQLHKVEEPAEASVQRDIDAVQTTPTETLQQQSVVISAPPPQSSRQSTSLSSQPLETIQQNGESYTLVKYSVNLSDPYTQKLLLDLAKREYYAKNYDIAESHCIQLCNQQPSYTNEGPIVLLSCIYYKTNRLDLSEHFCKLAIQLYPNLAEPHSNLGNVYINQGQLSLALEHYRRAISINPNFVDAYINLAAAYIEAGDLNQAKDSYHAALSLNPELYNVITDLGKVYKDMGQTDKAEECFVKALLIKPGFATAWNNLGCVFSDAGDLWKAIHHFDKAIAHDANFFEAYVNAGNVSKTARIFTKAEDYYMRALSLRPNHVLTLLNMAGVYQELGRLNLAIETYEKAIQLDNKLHDAYCGLGKCWQEKGFINTAEQYLNMALGLCPESADLYYALGNLKRQSGFLDEAMNFYLWAVKLAPNYMAAHWKLAESYKDCGQLVEAIQEYTKAVELGSELTSSPVITSKAAFIPNDSFCNLMFCRQTVSDWSENHTTGLYAVVGIVSRQLMEGDIPIPSIHPHHAFMFPWFSSAQRKSIANRHAAAVLERLQQLDGRPFKHSFPMRPVLGTIECMKIGYVTCDPRTTLLIKSLMGYHSQENVKIFCYTLCPLTEHGISFENVGNHVHVSLSEITCPRKAAKVIYDEGINILVNLTGYAKKARNEIFAMKPAPIQVTWMGGSGATRGTSGAAYMDYVITDVVTSPKQFESHFSEKLVYMSNTNYFGDHQQRFLNVQELPAYNRHQHGLPENAVIFCNFSQWFKIDPDTILLWMNILVEVPNSVLWLLRRHVTGSKGEESFQKITSLFGNFPERIIFTDVTSREEHLLRAQLADVFLDTPLCNGRYTSMDILWAGLPVVTMCSGETSGSRMTASLLMCLGIEELVAKNTTEFVEIGKKLGNDPEYRKAVREKIWQKRGEGRVFDGPGFAVDLEQSYARMWKAFSKKNKTKKDRIMTAWDIDTGGGDV